MSELHNLLKPFSKLEHLLNALYVLVHYSNYTILTKTNIINKLTSLNKNNSEIEDLNKRLNNFPELYGKNFFENSQLKESIDSILIEERILNFISEASVCEFCNSKLSGKQQDFSAVCYFYSSKPKKATIQTKSCEFCGAMHYLSYAEKSNSSERDRKILKNVLNAKFVAFTNETIFERLLLDSFTSDLIYKHSSFMGFTNAYNFLFKCKQDYLVDQDKVKRSCLNESRLIETWFYYQFLKCFNEINKSLLICPAPQMKNLNISIRKLKPSLVKFFVNKWSGKIFIYNKLLSFVIKTFCF